jgi:hypothetical protein
MTPPNAADTGWAVCQLLTLRIRRSPTLPELRTPQEHHELQECRVTDPGFSRTVSVVTSPSAIRSAIAESFADTVVQLVSRRCRYVPRRPDAEAMGLPLLT